MALVQLRNDTEGRRYYDRKLAAGKTKMEAMRCLKRRLSDIVYKTMRDDAQAIVAGPGGHSGAANDSSAVDSNPDIDASEKSLPGPANANATPDSGRRPERSTTRSRRQPQSA
jgi:hypothetical protein